MNKIWVITSGCYSDYGISGIFSTKEAAEKALGNGDDNDGSGSRIEEFPLDPGVEEMHAGRTAWQIKMLKDGTTEEIYHTSWIGFDPEVRVVPRSQYHWADGKPDYLDAWVWATDEQHAIKIVNERRLQEIAAGNF